MAELLRVKGFVEGDGDGLLNSNKNGRPQSNTVHWLEMDKIMSRFPHLMEEIFHKLDDKGLVKCREVSRTLQEFVDIKEYPWLRIVKIPTRLEKGITYLNIAVKYGQFGMFEWILDSETDKKALHEKSSSSFLHACYFGHVIIAEMLLNKLDELQYDLMRIGILLNDHHLMTKVMYVESGFKHACRAGRVNIVEMLIDKSENEKNNPLTKWNPTKSLRFDFTAKNNFGQTGFHLACGAGHSKVVEVLVDRSESLNFDLTAKNDFGHTGFHLACAAGHIKVVEVLKDKSEYLKIDLTAKDVQGYTGFQLAVKNGNEDVINWIKSEMPCLMIYFGVPNITLSLDKSLGSNFGVGGRSQTTFTKFGFF